MTAIIDDSVEDSWINKIKVKQSKLPMAEGKIVTERRWNGEPEDTRHKTTCDVGPWVRGKPDVVFGRQYFKEHHAKLLEEIEEMKRHGEANGEFITNPGLQIKSRN